MTFTFFKEIHWENIVLKKNVYLNIYNIIHYYYPAAPPQIAPVEDVIQHSPILLRRAVYQEEYVRIPNLSNIFAELYSPRKKKKDVFPQGQIETTLLYLSA